MVKPKYCFYYNREEIVMKKNVPVTLESDEEVARLVGSGLVEEYEEVHPNGNFNITTKGTFDIKRYATVTVNPTIYVVTLWGGNNLNDFSYLTFVAGETKPLPTEEEYLNVYEIEEGKHFAGWSTAKNDVDTKIDGNLKPTKDMNIYALILEDVEEEEEINE